MTKSIAIAFPGQGSQSVGMLTSLAERYSTVIQTFDEASESLGMDLWKLVSEGPEEELNKTENTQPAMLSAGVAVYRVWQEQGGAEPVIMAGHSLGEYSALTVAGSLSFGEAVPLVAARGRFMQQAVPEGTGAMAAILGLDDDVVTDLCARAAESEVVEPVNFNSPGQVVIAGSNEAVARAMTLAKDAGARRALPLPVSVPSHCALMKPAADQLSAMLETIEVNMPRFPVIHNVDVAASDSAAMIRDKLAQQLYRPVRWVETVRLMKGQGAELLLEMGPGKVLTGLAKRIDKTLTSLPVLDPVSLEQALEASHV